MINIKELRIDNLFEYEECYYKVACIGEKVKGINLNGFAPGLFHYEVINPISITENLDLLLKLGFDKHQHYFTYEPKFENIYYALKPFLSEWVLFKGFMNIEQEIQNLKYIHRLQNIIFELQNEELILNIKN